MQASEQKEVDPTEQPERQTALEEVDEVGLEEIVGGMNNPLYPPLP